MFRKALLTAAAAFVMLTLSSVARADTVTFGPGQFGSTATVTNYSLSGNTFTFTLTNTSSTGSITAIGFNLTGTNRGTFTLNTTTDSDFRLANEVKAQAGAQNTTSTFDFALLTGNNFGGGSVAGGIQAGQSGTFVITGDFSGMTEDEIARAILLRFQGIGPQDESEVIGPNPGEIPEPMTMILFGTGLAGIAARARRRNRKV
ncbi:MAG TPA: PEP-CTERM sorting domain-containing protein [Pyrinomonadaceae bacterium]|nr:PEP-CTERM sorting domain-containing protein [Pyrinomonadaceae bacterium]